MLTFKLEGWKMRKMRLAAYSVFIAVFVLCLSGRVLYAQEKQEYESAIDPKPSEPPQENQTIKEPQKG